MNVLGQNKNRIKHLTLDSAWQALNTIVEKTASMAKIFFVLLVNVFIGR